MITDELEAARFVRAALDLIMAQIPDGGPVMRDVLAWREENALTVRAAEKSAPSSTPDRPEVASTWAQVVAGDEVQAPDGAWYEVDSWSRIGQNVAVLIKVNGSTMKTTQNADTPVMVRQGPTSQAMAVLVAGGIEIERLG